MKILRGERFQKFLAGEKFIAWLTRFGISGKKVFLCEEKHEAEEKCVQKWNVRGKFGKTIKKVSIDLQQKREKNSNERNFLGKGKIVIFVILGRIFLSQGMSLKMKICGYFKNWKKLWMSKTPKKIKIKCSRSKKIPKSFVQILCRIPRAIKSFIKRKSSKQNQLNLIYHYKSFLDEKFSKFQFFQVFSLWWCWNE